MKTLTVDQRWNPNATPSPTMLDSDKYIYVPTKVTNSTTPKLGDYMTETELAVFCDSDDWEVTIK